MLVEPHTSILIEPGWRARVTGHDHVLLTRIEPREARVALGTKADPVLLEVFNNLYMSIAEQMGAVLENTAATVTIKERLDFSCAVFDAAGDLIANAPHMPVHLGSMGASVKAIVAQNPDMRPGDVFALNAPYNGGTHLPDITVVAPVWDDGGRARAVLHRRARTPHRRRRADAGLDAARQPDDPRRGRLHRQLDAGRARPVPRGRDPGDAAGAKYPARAPEINIADLKAQVAVLRQGRGRAARGWWRISGSTWSRPTWATSRTTPRRACAGRSRR